MEFRDDTFDSTGEFVSPNETTFFHYKDFWVLDLKSNIWEELATSCRPPARSGHRMVAWKNLLVVFGGFFDTYKETRYYNDLWVFDTVTYTWTQIDQGEVKPANRSGFQFFVHGDTIVLYGGYCKQSIKGRKSVGVMLRDVWFLRMNSELSQIKWEKRKNTGGMGPGYS